MARQVDIQRRFVELLAELTEARKVEWARSKIEIGFVYCSTPMELIVFEVSGNGGSLVEPTENVSGILSKCRNISYVWLEPSIGFNDLLKLLRQSPQDGEKFVEFRRRAHSAPIQALESLL